MSRESLTVRLSGREARLIVQISKVTGLSKAEVIGWALRSLEAGPGDATDIKSLFKLGARRFGRYGNARRQAVDVHRVVRSRVRAKRAEE